MVLNYFPRKNDLFSVAGCGLSETFKAKNTINVEKTLINIQCIKIC